MDRSDQRHDFPGNAPSTTHPAASVLTAAAHAPASASPAPGVSAATSTDALRDARGRRAIAILEATKGIGALLALAGVLSLLHHDLHRLVLSWIGHLGLDPDAHYPKIVLDGVDRINATPVRTIVLVAIAYAAGRFIEGYGLWRDRAWGSWFGVVTGAMYLPFEVHHLVIRPSWQAMLVLAVNVIIVAYLLWGLRQRRRLNG